MKLSINELLHGKAPWGSIFRKQASTQKQRSPGEIGRRLDRNSVELHKTRLQTRRCSLENCGMAAACEELHVVVPRQDSITLAKRRLSHDVHAAAAGDTAASADASSPTHAGSATAVDDSSSWHIPSQAAATA